jgi:uroporphyrinogen decarboxylase
MPAPRSLARPRFPLENPKPDFRRLRKTLLGGQADRVPMLEISIDRPVMEAFLGKPIKEYADHAEFWARAGYDHVTVFFGYRFAPRGATPKEGRRVTRFRRSLYTDEAVEREWRAEKSGWATTLAELKAFRWPRKSEAAFRSVDGIGEVLWRGQKVIAITTLHEQAASMLGTETLLYAVADQPGLVEYAYAKVGERIVHGFEEVAERPHVGALWLGDDLAYTEGMFYNPDVMRKTLFPWYREIGKIARAHNLPLVFHSDGDIRPVIPDLIEMGFNAIHPIEPKAMDIAEIKRAYGDRLCLCGNIDLCYTLTRGTPEEVRAEVKERIRTVGRGGGYAVGSANSVTDYVPLENYVAMLEAVRDYGRYPTAPARKRLRG